MSMRRSHKRLRLSQRRYYRMGRRKAPPDRPPGGKKLRPPRLPTRTYHFDTLPTTGASITPSEYTIYIHTRILALYHKRLPQYIQHRNYLRQQRTLYYKEFGLRYTHILPKHASKSNRMPSLEAQLFSDQLQHQLSEQAGIIIPHDFPLPPDPSLGPHTHPSPPTFPSPTPHFHFPSTPYPFPSASITTHILLAHGVRTIRRIFILLIGLLLFSYLWFHTNPTNSHVSTTTTCANHHSIIHLLSPLQENGLPTTSSLTISTSIKSPSIPTTTTTNTTLNLTPIPPRRNPTHAAAAATTKTSTTIFQSRKPSSVELASTMNSTTKASSTMSTITKPSSSIFTTVSNRSSKTSKRPFFNFRQLQSNHHLPTGATAADSTALWKKNCPDGPELTLYHYIKSKDDAALQNWFAMHSGKSAHSL